MMIKRRDIENIAQQIGHAFNPERVVLFGSYAYGEPDGNSDVDLLVVLPFAGRSSSKALEIMRNIKPRIPIDLVVRTPDSMRERLAMNDFFLREIGEKGEVLYEAPNA